MNREVSEARAASGRSRAEGAEGAASGAGGRSWFSRIALAQGVVWTASGLWPLVDMHSFTKVTGPKREPWLAKTVGLLISVIGVDLIAAGRADRRSPDLRRVAAGTAAALAAIDLVYVAKRRISPVYLLDAALELAFVGAWIAESRSDEKSEERAAS